MSKKFYPGDIVVCGWEEKGRRCWWIGELSYNPEDSPLLEWAAMSNVITFYEDGKVTFELFCDYIDSQQWARHANECEIDMYKLFCYQQRIWEH